MGRCMETSGRIGLQTATYTSYTYNLVLCLWSNQHIPDINSFQAGKVTDKVKGFSNISADFIFKVVNFLCIKLFFAQY